MDRSNWAKRAVVAVTSVQPTSDKRTVWHETGSRCGVAGGAGTANALEAMKQAAAQDAPRKAVSRSREGTRGQRGGRARRPGSGRALRVSTASPGSILDATFEWVFNVVRPARTMLS
jgi:hypothetical protein